MPAITFMSDFGEEDHYVAAVKAAILTISDQIKIIDISHLIHRHDIAHAAYVLKHVVPSFPAGTVHLVAVDPVLAGSGSLVALKLNGHFFVGHDSGVYSLLGFGAPEMAVEVVNTNSTFPARDFLAAAAAQLATGQPLEKLGKLKQDLHIRTERQLKATKREIVGQVIHIDHFGNLITNISHHDFDAICNIHGGNPSYTIRFARERFSQVNKNFGEVEAGECFVLFNAYGFLEIGINKGRAANLLGLRHDAPVIIEFNT